MEYRKPAGQNARRRRARSDADRVHPSVDVHNLPVVAGNQSESSATHARAGASGLLMSQPSGARSAHTPSNFSKPGMDFAAIVFSGPAATRFTRTRCGPRSRAR